MKKKKTLRSDCVGKRVRDDSAASRAVKRKEEGEKEGGKLESSYDGRDVAIANQSFSLNSCTCGKRDRATNIHSAFHYPGCRPQNCNAPISSENSNNIELSILRTRILNITPHTIGDENSSWGI